ncbi:hypothetical protein BRDID11002_12650 [Bradyrhizobium diazoefficiens]
MSVVATIAMLIVFVGSFVFYGIYLSYFPPPPGPPPLLPEAPDLVMIAVFLLVGLALAIVVALPADETNPGSAELLGGKPRAK